MNNYKIILIIFLSTFCFMNLKAQKGGMKISGTVVSSYGNQPLSDAVITLSGIDETVVIVSDDLLLIMCLLKLLYPYGVRAFIRKKNL